MIRAVLFILFGFFINQFYQTWLNTTSSIVDSLQQDHSLAQQLFSTVVPALAALSLIFVFCVLMPLERVAEHEHQASDASNFAPRFSAREYLARRGSF
mmetsp:Transcript_16105/g.27536  ORF Transcript_16105/g.27536 Transcript_16105/m.27536 type:complete len:98 (+) Transcript_16105:99-392(+)